MAKMNPEEFREWTHKLGGVTMEEFQASHGGLSLQEFIRAPEPTFKEAVNARTLEVLREALVKKEIEEFVNEDRKSSVELTNTPEYKRMSLAIMHDMRGPYFGAMNQASELAMLSEAFQKQEVEPKARGRATIPNEFVIKGWFLNEQRCVNQAKEIVNRNRKVRLTQMSDGTVNMTILGSFENDMKEFVWPNIYQLQRSTQSFRDWLNEFKEAIKVNKPKESGYGTEASHREGEMPEFSATDAAAVMNAHNNQSNSYQGKTKAPDKKFTLGEYP